jgi:DNA-binding IclR family transcriptional regulator
MLNTVNNVGLLLDLFDHHSPEWGVTEVSRELDMPKSNVHALLVSLVEIGILERTCRNRYRLGWRLVDLGQRIQRTSGLEEASHPVMVDLSASLIETVLLGVLERNKVLYIKRVGGRHPTVRLAGVAIGGSLPLHTTAAGKILMSERPEDEVRYLLGQDPLTALTEKTLTDIDEILEGLEQVRRRRMSFDLCETVPDACALGAPIRAEDGSIIAALTVAVPAYRFPHVSQNSADEIMQAAEKISANLFDMRLARPRPRHVAARLAVTHAAH